MVGADGFVDYDSPHLITFDCFSRKVENNAEWRAAEEARRLAVETALEELLARDTQYR